MKERILVAAVLSPIFFVILFFLPPVALGITVSLICAVVSYELINTVCAAMNKRIIVYAAISAAAIPLGFLFGYGVTVFQIALISLMTVMFIEAAVAFKTEKEISFAAISEVVFAGAIIPYLLSGLVGLKVMPEGQLLVLLPIIAAFMTDAGAYFVGVFLGKKKAVPLISPKKTVEGYVGGIVVGVACVMLYGVLIGAVTLHRVNFFALFAIGLVGGAITELGDLAFSLIKRQYDIKDYGKIFPGHGGMLDRFDSMIFAAPVVYAIVRLVPVIYFY